MMLTIIRMIMMMMKLSLEGLLATFSTTKPHTPPVGLHAKQQVTIS